MKPKLSVDATAVYGQKIADMQRVAEARHQRFSLQTPFAHYAGGEAALPVILWA